VPTRAILVRRLLRLASATALALSLAAPPAAAQWPAAAPGPGLAAAPGLPPSPEPLSLTISGGVSLGAWEAGFLHYAVGVIRENPGHTQLRLLTGASAGAANALMAVVAEYGAPAPTPDASIFQRTWIPLGMDQLFVPAEVGRQGVFSRRWTERLWRRIEEGLVAGLSESCDVVVGISVTRLVPRAVAITPGVTVPRVDEHFTLRITGRGPGRPPRLGNYVDPDWDQEQLLLPEEGPEREVPLAAVRDLLFASAAFPVAFPPQPLRHCVKRPEGGARLACPADEARTDLFVDGGLLDNSPVKLAARLAGSGLRVDADGRARWLPHPRLGEWLPPRRAAFAYVSPDVLAYPERVELVRIDGSTPVLRLAGQLGGAFFRTARAKNLAALLDERPELASTLLVPRRHYPPASQPMAAFLGFFETELRRFDFALGMYEAERMFDERERTLARALGVPVSIARPDRSHPSDSWRPLACLRAGLDERPEAAAACAGEALRELRILLQATLFRLWDGCAAPAGPTAAQAQAAAEVATDHPQCLRAGAGEPPPLVPGVEGAQKVAWRRGASEGELDHVMRILGELRFRWRDLGLGPGEGEHALGEIRQVTGRVVDALTAAQPPEDRLLVGTLGGVAANALAYAPARHRVWVAAGRALEIGFSHGVLPDRRRLPFRPHAALQLHGGLFDLSSDHPPLGFGLLAGLEVLPVQLATHQLQPSLILRGGVLLSGEDGWGARACPDPTSTEVAACTRPAAQALVALTVLERVRLHLLGEWYPSRAGRRPWAVAPAVGLQLNF